MTVDDQQINRMLWELWALTAEDDLLDQAAASYLGLNHTDTQCMGVLINMGPLPAGELAERIGVTSGTLTTVVDRLEALNFAARIADPTDRRRVLITATEEGEKRSYEIFRTVREQISELLADYDDDTTEQILNFLQQVKGIFGEQAAALRAHDIRIAR